MANSKVKHSRQKARLAARIKDWESMSGESDGKHKRINKSTFTKPGSNRK